MDVTMSETGKIYCLSGLGADEKIFADITINNHSLEFVPWLTPAPKEKISDYALRMAGQIPDKAPVLLGVSFGGMIAIEIAKQLPVKQVILISTVKTAAELPAWIKLVRRFKMNKWLPVKSNKLTRSLDNRQIGARTKMEKELVQQYREKSDALYMEWAINEIVNWTNDWYPEKAIHIHGDKDKMFPVRKSAAAILIKGGTHLMILNKAKEISDCINAKMYG
jgi:pimeloyl-ACP methyl ester carboxylesterase